MEKLPANEEKLKPGPLTMFECSLWGQVSQQYKLTGPLRRAGFHIFSHFMEPAAKNIFLDRANPAVGLRRS